jgi:hypothetical protein
MSKLVYDNKNERSVFLQGQVKWADGILANENVLYPSGKWSHDCAYDVKNDALDELIDHICLVV